MTNIVLDGASADAFGHPEECTEPASGSVSANSSITFEGTSIAVTNTATIEFSGHAHEYDADENACIDVQSHSVTPDVASHSVTFEGSPLLIEADGVGTDPGSGGDINMVDSGGNQSVRIF